MNWFHFGVVMVIVFLGGSAFYIGTHQNTVVWKDTGHVTNYQQYPVPFSHGYGDHLLQRMTIVTVNHGNITFDTANMCGKDIVLDYSCGSGSVDWSNGTWVFIYHLSNGGNFVGMLNP